MWPFLKRASFCKTARNVCKWYKLSILELFKLPRRATPLIKVTADFIPRTHPWSNLDNFVFNWGLPWPTWDHPVAYYDSHIFGILQNRSQFFSNDSYLLSFSENSCFSSKRFRNCLSQNPTTRTRIEQIDTQRYSTFMHCRVEVLRPWVFPRPKMW